MSLVPKVIFTQFLSLMIFSIHLFCLATSNGAFFYETFLVIVNHCVGSSKTGAWTWQKRVIFFLLGLQRKDEDLCHTKRTSNCQRVEALFNASLSTLIPRFSAEMVFAWTTNRSSSRFLHLPTSLEITWNMDVVALHSFPPSNPLLTKTKPTRPLQRLWQWRQ